MEPEKTCGDCKYLVQWALCARRGFLGFYKHIFQGPRDTPVKWVKAKPAPAAFTDGGKGEVSPQAEENREETRVRTAWFPDVPVFSLCVALFCLHKAQEAVTSTASGPSLQQSRENQAQRHLGECT